MWHGWGGNELSALKTSLAEFKNLHPEIEVTALQVPADRLQDKYVRSAAANGGPDVLIGSTDWVGKFVQSDLISPMDTAFDSGFLKRFTPSSLQAVTYRDHLYALPESMETVALIYNKALMPTPPQNLEELFNMTPKATYNLAYNTQFFFAAGYMFGMGAQLLDKQDQVTVASQSGERWLRLLKQMYGNPKLHIKSDYGRIDALFREKKAACTVNGPWALNDYKEVLGKDLGVAMLPRYEGRDAKPFLGIKCFMFNPNSSEKSRKNALAFVEFFNGQQNMKHMMTDAGHIPAVKDVLPPAGSPQEAFAKQAVLGFAMPAGPEMREVWTPMDRAIEENYTTDKTPEKILQDAQNIIRARVEEVKKQ